MGSVTLYLCLAIIPIIVYYYLVMRKKFRYWSDRNVAHFKPLPIFGNMLPILVGKISGNDSALQLYNGFPNSKVAGNYGFTIPGLLIRDTGLVEKILVKDFQYFADRNWPPADKNTLFNLGLFQLTGNTWRSFRNRISPTFTTGKLKLMFEQMVPCADVLVENFSKHKSENCDIKEELISYTIDITSNVVFGIEIKQGPLREEFKKHVSKIFDMSPYRMLLVSLTFIFPKFGKLFGIKFISDEAETYFRRIIQETFQQRKLSNQQRNDYVQLLLKLKEEGYLEMRHKYPEDDYLKVNEAEVVENIEITDDLLAAQAFQFIIAGFDPLYGTIQFLLHELSLNQEIQDKVRAEIKESVERNKEYTYKTLKDMTYLDQCIQETLRKYPIIPNIMRICLKDYPMEDGLIIEKGTLVTICVQGLHMDPNHFANPEVFDPDRFHPDSTVKRFSYLPFSDGPRMCIGMRFAMLEMKLALAKLLENYKFSVSPKTPQPLKIYSLSAFLKPVNLYFDVKRISNKDL